MEHESHLGDPGAPGGPSDPPSAPEASVAGPDPALLLADGPGVRSLGPATVDSDGDGIADTAVVPGAGDDLLGLATDLDGDGVVDVLTTVGLDGTADTRTVDDPDWDPGWQEPAPPAPTLDPATGTWTRWA